MAPAKAKRVPFSSHKSQKVWLLHILLTAHRASNHTVCEGGTTTQCKHFCQMYLHQQVYIREPAYTYIQ